MADTLGSLCDKLTIVKLKQWHAEDQERLTSLGQQEKQLQDEINVFVEDAILGRMPRERLTFASNKIYKQEGNAVPDVQGSLGEVYSRLAVVNCRLWHEQERVYDFERVPADQKDTVVKQLALLNLERTRCINEIDRLLLSAVERARM